MKNLQKTAAALLSAALLAGCAAAAKTTPAAPAADKLHIVTTIFPVYDWTRQVLGEAEDSVELTLLQGNGTDLHSYQPSAQDLATIAGCDLFVYVGGESDGWVADALQQTAGSDRKALSLMEALGSRVYEEETVEGMEAEEAHDGHDHEEPETDEHIWTSLRNAAELSSVIADALGEVDPTHAQRYTSNAAAYAEKLQTLDDAYAAAVAEAPVKTLLFGDRFPFRYLVEDYGLAYYAAFPGCSAETEASFETVAFLAGKVSELDLPAVLTIEGSDQKIAGTILQNAGGNRAILTLDAMQATTSQQAAEGITYLSVMERNLTALRQALGLQEAA